MTTGDLFDDPQQIGLGSGVLLLRRFAKDMDKTLIAAIQTIIAQTPLRHMITRVVTGCRKTMTIATLSA